ncbi:hypothetical protein MPLA_1270008 [Mesorhizobium sp. ORS 3359]|nr:hypothetical protein MPLA_1270008 [Mesorhizobium sp. ORS 3359]
MLPQHTVNHRCFAFLIHWRGDSATPGHVARGDKPERAAYDAVVRATPDHYLVGGHDAVRQNREKPS